MNEKFFPMWPKSYLPLYTAQSNCGRRVNILQKELPGHFLLEYVEKVLPISDYPSVIPDSRIVIKKDLEGTFFREFCGEDKEMVSAFRNFSDALSVAIGQNRFYNSKN